MQGLKMEPGSFVIDFFHPWDHFQISLRYALRLALSLL